VRLTNKQREIVERLAEGKTYGQIAAELNVSVNTVKAHTSSIRRVLGTRNKVDTVAVAVREGLVA
jgi:DNA-binding CsgD family transcriptional regulator